jgi:outer membrane protein insertion porin family
LSARLLEDGQMPAPRKRVWPLLVAWVLLWSIAPAAGQETSTAEGPIPIKLAAAVPLPPNLLGRPVLKLEVVTAGGRWQVPEKLQQNRLGQALSPAYARALMQELLATGRYADARASALPLGRAALLRITVVPRRIVTQVRVTGGGLEDNLILEAAGIGVGDDITLEMLPNIDLRVRELFRTRGFPEASVVTQAVDTDEPMHVVLHLSVRPGDPLLLAERDFEVHPRLTSELAQLLDAYPVEMGGRVDAEELKRADLDTTRRLRAAGYHDAAVDHRIEWREQGPHLVIVVWSGPKIRMRFEGNDSFDKDELTHELEASAEADAERSPVALSRRLHEFYVQRGFLDVSIDFERRENADGSLVDFVFRLRENPRVRVQARYFPCLTGQRSAADVAAEIDGVLSEALPGTSVFGPVDPNLLDQRLAPRSAGKQVAPLSLDPWTTYDPSVYEKALEHLRGLYRSEGYLSAQVGPVLVFRRACDPRSPAGKCLPVAAASLPTAACQRDPSAGETAARAPTTGLTCVPDSKRGLRCESSVQLQIPVVLGPRAALWDIGFDGNRTLVESELRDVTGLDLGGPVSQLELEEARRRIVERYAEEGYVFAGVEVDLELSPDRTRARAKFVISEREPVTVRDVIVHGAHFTAPDLILSRAALKPGDVYRRSLVRATEERLATLGVFTSVTVDLEDPEVPARQKVAVIRVQERLPQYLDVRPGFSTGEGLRIAFEYGHRNLAQRAISLVLRVQLGYLPPPLILESGLRRTFEQLLDRESILFLLERRNSAALEFPEVGLGPLFRLGVEGLDVRDVSREFAIEKRAAIVTLSYRPGRAFNVSLGAALELNEADIYSDVLSDDGELTPLEDYLAQNPGNRALRNLLNIPTGFTLAASQRIGVTWDRRDNAVAATRGTLLSVNVEHVQAFPIERADSGAAVPRSDFKSHFLQYTGRIAGYLRLTDGGLALATSFRWGFNHQLESGSSTYPDRLFFLGGVDSLRGFPLWSLVPEDLDRRLRATSGAAGNVQLRDVDIPVRGGNLLLNPRAELRVPIVGIWQTAVFLDTGNLWLESSEVFNSFRLRYSAGIGLRVNTPVGPLALDYGVNLDRRYYEEFGAFHFSIGLF